MALTQKLLASGPGWRVHDVVCTAGPHDCPFEEQHTAMCIAAVLQGTFRYRSTQGSATLTPGALLLGNHRHGFVCDHEHGTGDRCIAFHFTPEFFATVVADVPGARHTAFALPRLPPLAALLPLVAAAHAASDAGDSAAFEELALGFAGMVPTVLGGARQALRAPSARDERRVAAALHRIERTAHEQISLAELAQEAAASPYHFLRIFRQVVGMTPHQFVLHTRLHRAAVRLRRSPDSVLAVALEAGFQDLSTFTRRFRQVMGASPSAYRSAGAAAAIGTLQDGARSTIHQITELRQRERRRPHTAR